MEAEARRTKGAGKGAPPPPPRSSGQAAAAKAKALAASALKKPQAGECVGMASLLQRVEEWQEEMDEKNAMEIENVDLSGIDPNSKGETRVCPRCQLEVLVSEFQSHSNAHSSEIRDWLFLGGTRNAENVKELTVRTRITHILCMAAEVTMDAKWRQEWEDYNKERGVCSVVEKFTWNDSADQDILRELEGALHFIHAARAQDPAHRVLVHCVQGISRSATVVIAYLMKHERMSLRDAYQHVKRARPVIEPRAAFIDQLGRVECTMFGLSQATLRSEEIYTGKTMLNLDAPLAAPSLLAAEAGTGTAGATEER